MSPPPRPFPCRVRDNAGGVTAVTPVPGHVDRSQHALVVAAACRTRERAPHLRLVRREGCDGGADGGGGKGGGVEGGGGDGGGDGGGEAAVRVAEATVAVRVEAAKVAVAMAAVRVAAAKVAAAKVVTVAKAAVAGVQNLDETNYEHQHAYTKVHQGQSGTRGE